MAGNTKTSKSSAPKSAQTSPGSKGVKVGVNPKASVQSTAQVSKMKMGGKVGKKKC